MKLLSSLFIGLFLLAASPAAAADNEKLIEKVKNAVALLYKQDSHGTMSMACTATIFEKEKDVYRFVSAAHCVGDDDVAKEHSADAVNTPFYLTFDRSSPKEFWPAEPKLVGYQHRGDDFAVFEVNAKEDWPIIPLGDEKQEHEGSAILNVAAPLGLSKQVFHGSISSLDLDRPIIENDINWRHAMLLQIQAGPGSSGSALVSSEHENIVGLLVGTVGGGSVVGIPISKFKAALVAQAAGKYHWYHIAE